jgi:hypothetical protein
MILFVDSWGGAVPLGHRAQDYATPAEGVPQYGKHIPRPEDLLVKPGLVNGHWGVGNGGDWLHLSMARAKDHAATIVSRLRPDSLRQVKDPDVREWILANQKELAADIVASEHIWNDSQRQGQQTCGWTIRPVGAAELPVNYPIWFSDQRCARSMRSFNEASQLLIHEAIHHFDKGEDFANSAAVAIIDAYRSGDIDWRPIASEGAPEAREFHSAVWTGDRMIVYGGRQSEDNNNASFHVLNSAAAFDPLTHTWTELPTLTQSTRRYMHEAQWVAPANEDENGRMVVWGGLYDISSQSKQWLYEGFVWADGRQQLTPISAPKGWQPREYLNPTVPQQRMVMISDDLLAVWGGVDDTEQGSALGGIYDLAQKKWVSELARDHPQAPKRSGGHTLTWTGRELIVWGGYGERGMSLRETKNDGAILRLVDDRGALLPESELAWRRIGGEGSGAPEPRAGHSAAWTGQKMIVFSGGGIQSRIQLTGTGGLYDPATDSWETFETDMVMERTGHTAVWNGSKLLVMGGSSTRLNTFLRQVFAFDPEAQRWEGFSSKQDPAKRRFHSAVWTGSSLIIWGGHSQDVTARGQGRYPMLNDGGIFYP